jgi:hypothetical protein
MKGLAAAAPNVRPRVRIAWQPTGSLLSAVFYNRPPEAFPKAAEKLKLAMISKD